MTDAETCGELIFSRRSRNSWSDKPVSEAQLHSLYDLARLGPTSLNCSPARFRFLRSREAKERLAPLLMETNRAKALAAPCVVIIAYDVEFFEKMPQLFPSRPGIREMFAANAEAAQVTAFRNGTLQGAYLMVAARTIGLDCGPMSGFDNAAVDAEFFAGTPLKSNFLCGLGYPNDEPFPRLPRLDFAEAADVL